MTNTVRNRKICFVITGLSFGGAENQLLNISKVLKKREWGVHVVSMCPPLAYLEEFAAFDIPVYTLNMRRSFPDLRAIFRFAKLIRQIQPCLVHSHMVHANIFARIARIFCSYNGLVCTAHSINEGKKWRQIAYRFTDPLCDLMTNVCQAGVMRSISVGSVSQSKIRQIPNGIVASEFSLDSHIRKKTRSDMGLNGNFVFLAVGRFEEPKDYPNMLRAFSLLIKVVPNVVLLLVGDGILRNNMELLADDLGVSQSVRFLGIRRDIPSLMNAADGYVMSSAWEGLPIVLLEAAATGLPIVATDVGGNCEIVKDGYNGYLVPSRNEKELAAAMEKLIKLDVVTRRSMGDASHEIIRTNYDIECVVDTWESIYNKYCE